jgi:hypothetical protein
MNTGISILIVFWLLYSVLTIYGVAKFPAYELGLKVQEVLLVLLLPIFGSYLANRNMGHRFSEAAKRDLTYELPWWANLTFGTTNSSDFDDD